MNITFEFKTEFWTPTYTQISANTINDFKNAIKLIPLNSLLYHFYINIFNYNLISSIYTNDIAYWFYKNGYYSIAEEIKTNFYNNSLSELSEFIKNVNNNQFKDINPDLIIKLGNIKLVPID